MSSMNILKHPLLRAVLLSTALAGLTAALRADDAATSTQLKFSDPAKPGTLKVLLPWGDIHISGTDAADISITSSLSQKGKESPRADGLRRLDDEPAFALAEKGNVATLSLESDNPAAAQDAVFTIAVPRRTALIIRTEIGGDVVVENVDGDIEANSMNGEITLRGIGGSAVVSSMNGGISAHYRTVPAKPVSLSSMNGEVVLQLPTATKANLRMRSQNGTLLTDFPAEILKTKTEHPVVATDDAKSAKHEAKAAKREAEKAQREFQQAQQEREKAAQEGRSADAIPVPPLPPLPPFAVGKSITGTLNGGGVDISLATMNGSITVRQSDGQATATEPAPPATPKP